MREEDRVLHWWYRAREQGEDEISTITDIGMIEKFDDGWVLDTRPLP